MSIQLGRYKDYYWLKSEHIEPREVLEKCINFLIDKYLAITAFDSGELSLSTEDKEAGWKKINGIAYSPKLTELKIGSIPHFGFDEWYFLKSEKLIEVAEVFVNYGRFDISDQQTTKRFWEQIEKIKPYVYISDGDELTVVTKDDNFIDSVNNFRQHEVSAMLLTNVSYLHSAYQLWVAEY